MNTQKDNDNSSEQNDFWDSLQMDIIISNQKLTAKDYYTFIERGFMFSLFFRGCPALEITAFQEMYHIKDYAYVILLEFVEQSKTIILGSSIDDDFKLHYLIKDALKDKNCAVGPMITNRICILISQDSVLSEQVHRDESISISRLLAKTIGDEFNVTVKAGVGSIQKLHSIYTSFLDSLACMYYNNPDHMTHYLDIQQTIDLSTFDYAETEKHLIEAIRLRKTEAYDYFGIMMNWIRPLSDDVKRNKILELLVLSNHAMSIDSQADTKYINYSGYVEKFMELKGEKLIEFAFQSFIYITSYVKPRTTIDYTNHIVKTTRDYLEKHYTEDISLEDMASQVSISPQYFSKLIKKTTGFNFIDWLSMLRVKKAKELLTDSGLTVKEVCFMVGYKDPNYFSRIFKKRIGITPSEYVKTRSLLSNKN